MTIWYHAIPMEVHSQLYVGDYFADTLHFSAREHRIFGSLLLDLWLADSRSDAAEIANAIGVSHAEWQEVCVAVMPLFQIAAHNIEDWKKALQVYDGQRLPAAEWHIVRTIVLVRDNRICVYCGGENASHIDHIVAVSRGGTNSFANLTTSCGLCNQSKGPKALGDWKASTMTKTPTHKKRRKITRCRK